MKTGDVSQSLEAKHSLLSPMRELGLSLSGLVFSDIDNESTVENPLT